jgi:hypothetical protein
VHCQVKVDAALAAPRPERTYSAEEAQVAFMCGARFGDNECMDLCGTEWTKAVKAEAARRYGKRKAEGFESMLEDQIDRNQKRKAGEAGRCAEWATTGLWREEK